METAVAVEVSAVEVRDRLLGFVDDRPPGFGPFLLRDRRGSVARRVLRAAGRGIAGPVEVC
jgi:hypothetical protein